MQALESELGEPARGEHDGTDEEEDDVPEEDEGVAAAAIGTEPLRRNESKGNTNHRPKRRVGCLGVYYRAWWRFMIAAKL